LLYIGNSQVGYVSAALFNKSTGAYCGLYLPYSAEKLFITRGAMWGRSRPAIPRARVMSLCGGVWLLRWHHQCDVHGSTLHAERGCRVSVSDDLSPGLLSITGCSSTAVLAGKRPANAPAQENLRSFRYVCHDEIDFCRSCLTLALASASRAGCVSCATAARQSGC